MTRSNYILDSTSHLMPGEIALGSTFKLLSGHTIPLLGLGVFQNRDACKESCLAAFNAGYVYALDRRTLTLSSTLYSHVDSAQVYRNEEQVGQAVKESGIPREKLFISAHALLLPSSPA